MTDHGFGNDFVFEIQLQLAFIVDEQVKQVFHVLAKHLAGMEGDSGGHVFRTDDGHAVLHYSFAGFAQITVAATFCGQSTIMEPGFMAFTMSSVTRIGLLAPGMAAVVMMTSISLTTSVISSR